MRRTRLVSIPVCLALLAVPAVTHAQNWKIETRADLEETYTDNVRLVDVNTESDWVTRVGGGLSINGRGGRSELRLSSNLAAYWHAKADDDNRVVLDLNGSGKLEAIENFFFIDADARASEERVSAFGSDAGDGANANGNRAQFGSFSLAPRIVWRFGNSGQGALNYRATWSDSDSAAYQSELTHQTTLSLASRPGVGRFGWSLLGQDRRSDGKNTTDTQAQTVRVALLYQYSTELETNLHAGRERNDYANGSSVGSNNWGAGLTWRPSTRSTLTADATRRFFGTGYKLNFSRQTPLSGFRIGLSRDVSDSASDVSFGVIGQNGAPAGQLNLLNQNRSVERAASLSASLKGLRNTVTLDLARIERERLNQSQTSLLGILVGDLATYTKVTEDRAAIGWALRATPLTTVNTKLAYTGADGEGSTAARRHQTSLETSFGSRLSPKSNIGLSYRHTRSRGSSVYRENMLRATLTHTF